MVLSGITVPRFLPRLGLIFYSLLSLVIGRAQPAEVAGTMPEDYLPSLRPILVTALQRSPQVVEAHFLIESREAGRIAANAARLPNLGANINYGIREEAISGNANSSSRDQGLNYNIALNQPVFHWGALKNQSDIARINVLLAEKNLAKAYRELGVLLRRLYLNLIVTKARVRHSRESVKLLNESVNVLKQRLDRGEVSPAEVAGEELRGKEASYEMRRIEGDFFTARRTFCRLAGIPKLEEDEVPNEIPNPVYSSDLTTALSSTLLRDGAKSTLEAEMHALRGREALLRYNIERVRLLPKFSLGASYGLQNTTNVINNLVDQRAVAQQAVTFGANWAIFDGFATRAAKREARASQRVVEARRQVELDALMEEAQALERQLKLDAELLELADIRRALAVEGRKRIADEVALGKMAPGEADRAQVGILAAEANALASRAAFLDRWSAFVSVAGDDPVLNNLPVRHVRPKK